MMMCGRLGQPIGPHPPTKKAPPTQLPALRCESRDLEIAVVKKEEHRVSDMSPPASLMGSANSESHQPAQPMTDSAGLAASWIAALQDPPEATMPGDVLAALPGIQAPHFVGAYHHAAWSNLPERSTLRPRPSTCMMGLEPVPPTATGPIIPDDGDDDDDDDDGGAPNAKKAKVEDVGLVMPFEESGSITETSHMRYLPRSAIGTTETMTLQHWDSWSEAWHRRPICPHVDLSDIAAPPTAEEEPVEETAELLAEEKPADEAEKPAKDEEQTVDKKERQEAQAENDGGPAKRPPGIDDDDTSCDTNVAHRVSVVGAGVRDIEVEARRRDGMQGASVKIDNVGVFVRISASREDQDRAMAAVLKLRAQVLRDNLLPEDTPCMPWRLQKAVTQLVQQQWWNELPTERQDELARRCHTASDVSRTKASYCRACTRQHFGGVEWFQCIVALGAAPPAEMIVALNETSCAEVSTLSTKSGLKQSGRTGVRHTVTEAKKLREAAKLKEKQYDKMTAAYKRGEWVDWCEYNRLQQTVEACSIRRSERSNKSCRREVGPGEGEFD